MLLIRQLTCVLLLLAGVCASGATAAVPAIGPGGPIGCFSVELQPLASPDSPTFEPFAQKSIRLTNEAVMTRRFLAFKVVPLANTPFMYRLAFWRQHGDEVTLTFTEDERAGLRMHLHQTAAGLEGVLKSYGGASDIEDVFSVVARRIDCRVPVEPGDEDAAPGAGDEVRRE